VSAPTLPPGAVLAPAPANGTPKGARTARVAVLGASGYAGQEFVRLSLTHPGVTLTALVSREFAGRSAAGLLPGLDARAVKLPDPIAPEALPALWAAGGFDTLVSALPHGALKALLTEQPQLASPELRVLDLSQDHRAGEAGYVYGLPEAFRAQLAGATHVANPGCYATAAALALLPAAEAGWLAGPVTVSALSGISGAGRAPALRTSFVELEGGAAIYKAGESHAHVPEMARTLARLTGGDHAVAFVPQMAPMARGIVLTASVTLAEPVSPDDAHALYEQRYAGEWFVRMLASGDWPETRAVRASNRCDVAVTTVHGGRTLIATTALDNLVKGAAGQAMQNLNLMLGWPESWGLPVHGNPW